MKNFLKLQKPILTILVLSTIFLQTEKAFCRISSGVCSNSDPRYETIIKDPSDYHKYLGKWYEIVRDKETPFQKGSCGSAFYCLNKEGFISMLNQELRGRRIIRAKGEAKLTKDLNKLKLHFDEVDYKGYENWEYRIINTDFKNYSVVYTCQQLDQNKKLELIWIIARDPSKITDKILESWKTYLDMKFGYDDDDLLITSHNSPNCIIFDEIDKKVKRDILC